MAQCPCHIISGNSHSLNDFKADLHDATLTHATSLQQAYDMISDHLHAHDINFSLTRLNMQKFAPGFTEWKF